MTGVIQTITPTQPQYSLINQSWINPGTGYAVLGLLQDRTTFVAGNGMKLYTSTNLDTSATPTWTQIADFTTARGSTVQGFLELPNGEAAVYCSDSGYAPNLSHIYISSGWSVNKATATWTKYLSTVGGPITSAYSFHDWSVGTDGTIIVSDSGSQTTGNPANDNGAARRVYLSKDFGKTWNIIFDIYAFAATQGFTNPAGVHIHGTSYDQDWGRIWVCYGDNTGQGKNIAGGGYMQVVYSDDGGVTWTKMPSPTYWYAGATVGTMQIITIAIFNNAIVMTPDNTDPVAPLVYPKLGYRVLGEPHCGPMYNSGAIGGQPRKVIRNSRFPTFFAGSDYKSSIGYNLEWRIPVTDDGGFTWSQLRGVIPPQTPTLTSTGFNSVLGPTLNGKVVCLGGLFINNDNTKRTMVADLVQS